MSALFVLYFVLPLPVLFLMHDAEEVLTVRRWMQNHREQLLFRFPRAERMIAHLAGMTTRAFLVVAFEEFLMLMAVTLYVLVDGPWAWVLWSAVFLVFSIHLLIHIAQALLVRGYVPGLVTSVLMLPFCGWVAHSIWLTLYAWQMLLCAVCGFLFVALNLLFAHWLGRRLG